MRKKHDKQWIHDRLAEGGRITTTRRRTKTEAVIRKACSELVEKGINLTIDTVAERAGIHRSSVHRYYKVLEEYRQSASLNCSA